MPIHSDRYRGKPESPRIDERFRAAQETLKPYADNLRTRGLLRLGYAVYRAAVSPFMRKVRVVLIEKGLAFDRLLTGVT
jgi:hypothetical protein